MPFGAFEAALADAANADAAQRIQQLTDALAAQPPSAERLAAIRCCSLLLIQDIPSKQPPPASAAEFATLGKIAQ